MIALTPGEPAGIGIDISIINAQKEHSNFITFADPDLLIQRSKLLGLNIKITDKPTTNAGELFVFPVKLKNKAIAGKLDAENANYVLETIKIATNYCLKNKIPLLTCPIHKGVINQSGIKFSGHTEYLAQLSGVGKTVMMLVTKNLKVALATTHLPLKDVSKAITKELLIQAIQIIDRELKNPRISILGLNPHAGEDGYLGSEEITTINPVAKMLRQKGVDISDAIPADTAFTPDNLKGVGVVLAMYHDQGLPVLKTLGFKNSVNVTLGLPFMRVSVDHGTALDLAGKRNFSKISLGSFQTALNYIKQQ